jgi:hypothetical protein
VEEEREVERGSVFESEKKMGGGKREREQTCEIL